MITKEVIELGFAMGVINLVVDPNMESGTVCQIGDNWFYFGGHTAEDESPEQYIAHVPFEDIVNEVFTTLEAFREDCNSEEYEYYEALLMGLPESVKLTAEQGVCRICCPESCLASWQCQRMHKATSHLPKIAKEDKCPMEARFFPDGKIPSWVVEKAGDPSEYQLAAICSTCPHSKATANGIKLTGFYAACIDCPVNLMREAIGECRAEANMS